MTSKKPKKSKKSVPFPTKEEILRFVADSPGEVGKREIARAFNIRGHDRVALKQLMRDMADEGLFHRRRKRRVAHPDRLPSVAVVEITGVDIDGDVLAQLAKWEGEGKSPTIVMTPSRGPAGALGTGDRVLTRLKRLEDGHYVGQAMRRLDSVRREVLGVYFKADGRGRIVPTDKKVRSEPTVDERDSKGAKHGELVIAELIAGGGRGMGGRSARITETLGRGDTPRSASLIAIHTHDLPQDFDDATLREAEDAKPVELGTRTDLRDFPLVTIDPEDARDHDDAIWAEADQDEKNRGGWHVVVAIADVAHYVRPRSALDKTAYLRGNSVYFPDQVIPMLPEVLSNGLCSLKAGVDRPCLAAHLWLTRDGDLTKHAFVRGLMRTAANLHYGQVQSAIDGHADEATEPLHDPVIRPLYEAYNARLTERHKREPLDLNLPERKIDLDSEGNVIALGERVRLDAHRLVEEFMIAANVAAAETLERLQMPCMYRVHEAPSPEKLTALREFLESAGQGLAKAQRIEPRHFNRILQRVAETPVENTVNTVILRSQSQAFYSPANLGHFGLSLNRYAHFTSPIRRYSDLLVHRALVSGLKLGDDGLDPDAEGRFTELGEHISVTERRAMTAERDAVDRYVAGYMKDRIGGQFEAAISGVTRFGLFVTLSDTGAEGLVPMRDLGDDYYRHDEARHALVGERSKRRFTLGDTVTVRLREAEPLSGALRFELLYERGRTQRGARRPRRKTP